MVQMKDLSVPVEAVLAAAAFLLGAAAYIALEGWIADATLIATSLVAVVLLWQARAQATGQGAGWTWNDPTKGDEAQEVQVSTELLGAATAFTIGAIGFMLWDTTWGLMALLTGSAVALWLLWRAHEDAGGTD